MRPVRRGSSPVQEDFKNYRDAAPYLISRMGSFCSYCERRIMTQLAVEHIQPKGLTKYKNLEGTWENYLLSCVNCNSTKKDQDVVLSEVLLPDRDNTFFAFEYLPDGVIRPSAACSPAIQLMGEKTLSLVGLDKRPSQIKDENGRLIAMERFGQRREIWEIALEAKREIVAAPNNSALRRATVNLAHSNGFFSIWMTVFVDDPDMCRRLVDAFDGTRASGCFSSTGGLPVSPAPNPDGLASGGKT